MGGLVVLAAWLLWEYGEVRHPMVQGPAAVTYGPIVGIVAGALVGLIATLVVRTIVSRRQRALRQG